MREKILIVDDEIMLTELLYAHFSEQGYLVYVANSSEDAIDRLKETPDIILLDINMPGMDGLTLCKNIREIISCPILFLTAKITEQDKINGLQAGGDDYITKPFSLQELSVRVEAHLRREARYRQTSQIISSNGLIVDSVSKTVMFAGKEITFSKTEYEIIEYLISNRNQVFERERIYEAVWGYDGDGDSKVIKEHIRKIRVKLLEATGKEYIETVWGVGYKWKK